MMTAAEAAKLAGVGKSTVMRAIKKGALSVQKDAMGVYKIDAAEFARWREAEAAARLEGLPLDVLQTEPRRFKGGDEGASDRAALEARYAAEARASIAEAEAKTLRERLAETARLVEEAKSDRDAWKLQAERLLLMTQPPAPPPSAESPSGTQQERPSLWKRLFG